jgi:hypothetical protein
MDAEHRLSTPFSLRKNGTRRTDPTHLNSGNALIRRERRRSQSLRTRQPPGERTNVPLVLVGSSPFDQKGQQRQQNEADDQQLIQARRDAFRRHAPGLTGERQRGLLGFQQIVAYGNNGQQDEADQECQRHGLHHGQSNSASANPTVRHAEQSQRDNGPYEIGCELHALILRHLSARLLTGQTKSV